MKKTTKSLSIIIKKELKQKEELMDLLENMSRKRSRAHEPVKKNKDKDGQAQETEGNA